MDRSERSRLPLVRTGAGRLGVFRVVAVVALCGACDKKLPPPPELSHPDASSASAVSETTPKFALYGEFAATARATDPEALPAGDVARAKGRRVAPIERRVQQTWSAADQARIDNGSPQVRALVGALTKPRAPFCATGGWSACVGKPWYADNPSDAGIVLYVDRKSAPAGTYHFAGSSARLATGYETVLQFTAVLVPENVRVARWARYCPPPLETSAIGGRALMQVGALTQSASDADMAALTSGEAPKGDFPLSAPDAG